MADTALAEHEVIAGLDIGGTKMLGVLIDGRGTVKARLRRPTTMRGDDAVRDGILDMLQALIDPVGNKDCLRSGSASARRDT